MVLDDLGLISAVKWYLSTFMKDSEIDFKFKHPGIFPSLDPEKRLVMFRVLTEAVHNAVKYSSATQITIELKRIGKKKIGLSVKDNGKGFDFEDVYNKSKSLPGIGLLAMNERASHINADCEILTAEGKGCLVKLTVPM
jgi:signal transduction histidine kinase